MNRSIFSFLCALFFLSSGLTANAQTDRDLLQLQIDVVYLSADLLQGRQTGAVGEQMAADYISGRFGQMGILPKGKDNTWYQPFDFKYKPNPHADGGETRTGKNVVGFIDNHAPTTIVIGAHYDHLGHGGSGSGSLLAKDTALIHNGADDNASGVATLLLLAEWLNNSPLKQNNYLFVAFSGEEMGLFGSKHFVEHSGLDSTQVNYMLNMDMVGRLNAEKVLAVNGTGTSPAWKEAFPKIKSSISVKSSDSGIGPSDHTSFYLANIPALHFFTGQHTDYHKPSDDSELVNYQGIYEVSLFIYQLIAQLDGAGKIAFTKTKDEDQSRKAAAFKVTLGVMPDYVFQGEGMRIDGVMDDRPAAKAGLEKGDIVIKIGEKDVKSIYDYMDGLAQFKAGDTTRIVVKRGDKVMVKNVTF